MQECKCTCRSAFARQANRVPQMSQPKGRSCVWTRMWRSSLLLLGKTLVQFVHAWGTFLDLSVGEVEPSESGDEIAVAASFREK